MEGDVVLMEDLLIQFAKDIPNACLPCLGLERAGLAVSARFDRQTDIQIHNWIE